jgi:adenosylhomocysteine nucleosidase
MKSRVNLAGRIGIIGAMPQEIEGVLELLESKEQRIIGGRTYYTGRIDRKEVVVVFSHWGKVAAAITATTLIQVLGINKLIFTGVAGGISPDLRIGDIVLGDELIHHDFDASPIAPRFEIPLVGKSRIPADTVLNELAMEAIDRFLSNRATKLAQGLQTYSENRTKPALFRGLIASGDQFFSSHEQRERLRGDLPDVLCVEMEGAAVAQVCYESDIPFCVIRTISDSADDRSPADFQDFIDRVASTYSREIIQNMMIGMH